MNLSTCLGCGVVLPDIGDGPTHRYMTSSPACWAAYGVLLSREYSDQRYRTAHRLTVDTYAVQHPGDGSRQAIQSVAVHLIALHLTLELEWPAANVTSVIGRAVDTQTFESLNPGKRHGVLTVQHAVDATSPEEHAEKIRQWAESAWDSWSHCHEKIRLWARSFIPN